MTSAPIRRGQIIGHRIGGDPKDEAEHFIKCQTCGGLMDMRDLGQILEHESGQCPAQDRPQ